MIEFNDNELSVISQVNIGGVDYKIKDTAARNEITALDARVTQNESDIGTNAQDIADIKKEIKGGIHYLGKTRTVLTEGASPDYIEVLIGEDWVKYYKSSKEGEERKLLKAGDMVIEHEETASGEAQEFIWNGTTWNRLGSTKGLGSLAFKDEASGTATPTGEVTVNAIADASYALDGSITINEVSATGQVTVNEVSATAQFAGNSTTPTAAFTGTELTATGSITIGQITPTAGFTGTQADLSVEGVAAGNVTMKEYTPAGSVTVDQFTPAGSIAQQNVNVTLSSKATGSATVANEILTISFGNALTSVTATVDQAQFTGTPVTPTAGFSGTAAVLSATFAGTKTSSTGKYTPAGSIAVDAFTPTGSMSINPFTPAGSIAVDPVTPTGSVTVAKFTPTASVAINKFTPTGTVTGTTTVTGHTHTASFAGDVLSVTVE